VLTRLTVTFSSDIDPAQAQNNVLPQLIDVYFESAPTITLPAGGTSPAPGIVIVLHGTTEIVASDAINWRLRDTDQSGVLKGPGRVLVRIRCGYLLDKEGRSYSAAPDTLIRAATPHIPGGILESWFTIPG
jgi:hypothetical protein